MLEQRVAQTGMSVVYCNLVGGQDELVFDGASCLLRSGRSSGSCAYRSSLNHLLMQTWTSRVLGER